MDDNPDQKKPRTPGVPTGNAGEYFVMGELLRRDFDAQLADRNTKGYDLLAGGTHEPMLWKVQVKTVRAPPWYVNLAAFSGDLLNQGNCPAPPGVIGSRQQATRDRCSYWGGAESI